MFFSIITWTLIKVQHSLTMSAVANLMASNFGKQALLIYKIKMNPNIEK
jgi:hypothetical protein